MEGGVEGAGGLGMEGRVEGAGGLGMEGRVEGAGGLGMEGGVEGAGGLGMVGGVEGAGGRGHGRWGRVGSGGLPSSNCSQMGGVRNALSVMTYTYKRVVNYLSVMPYKRVVNTLSVMPFKRVVNTLSVMPCSQMGGVRNALSYHVSILLYMRSDGRPLCL